jgi:YtkA-like
MLLLISITLIILLTSYVMFLTFKKKRRLTCMAGMMISMTNSMMASITIGTILGTLIQNKDLTIPTIVSVSIGMIVGYLTGIPVSLIAAIDGLTAGIMGGMMGAMLGVMLQPKSAEIMIYFLNVVFVLVIWLLIRLINQNSTTKQEQETSVRNPLVANPIFLILLLVFMGVLVFGQQAPENSNADHSHHYPHSNVSIEFEKNETITADNEIALSAKIQNESQPLTDAIVIFEVWKEDDGEHEYIDAIEERNGEYKARYTFPSQGTYKVKVHVNKEEIHEHIQQSIEVK